MRSFPAMSALRLGLAAMVLVSNLSTGIAVAKGSGGYSRPSVSISRTPSVSSFSRSTGTSGGYARPADRTPSTLSRSRSAGDTAITRQSSGDAYRDMRQRRDTVEPSQPSQPSSPSWGRPTWTERDRTPSVRDTRRYDDGPIYVPTPRRDPGYGSDYGSGYAGGYDQVPRRRAEPVRPRWAGDPSWSAPAWVTPNTNAGQWNPLLLWYLLDTMSRPGHAEWFRQHRDDAGYREWRRAADQTASTNADLKGKLDALDSELGAPLSGARDENYLPPDVSASQAKVPEASGFGFLLLLLIIAAIVAGGVWYLRNRSRRETSMSRTGVSDVVRVAEGAVRNKFGLEKPAKRAPFRIGQAISLDTTPFILARDSIRVKAPASESVSVTAIGRIDGMPLTRLYLGDERFLQVHLSDAGSVDECRYFSLDDTVFPADDEEWEFWLPKDGARPSAEGEWMIGAPVFETKDGARWDRVWSPGEGNVLPVEATETREGGSGPSKRSLSSMLYAKATGIASPDREYLLIVAWRASDGAGVDLYVGIDVPHASLDLTN